VAGCPPSHMTRKLLERQPVAVERHHRCCERLHRVIIRAQFTSHSIAQRRQPAAPAPLLLRTATLEPRDRPSWCREHRRCHRLCQFPEFQNPRRGGCAWPLNWSASSCCDESGGDVLGGGFICILGKTNCYRQRRKHEL
jgi:hypothetical protein